MSFSPPAQLSGIVYHGNRQILPGNYLEIFGMLFALTM